MALKFQRAGKRLVKLGRHKGDGDVGLGFEGGVGFRVLGLSV